MKKAVFVASYIVLGSMALSSVASAQPNVAAEPSKLVQTVRNSTATVSWT